VCGNATNPVDPIKAHYQLNHLITSQLATYYQREIKQNHLRASFSRYTREEDQDNEDDKDQDKDEEVE